MGRAGAGCLCPMKPRCGHGGGHSGPEPAIPHAFGGSSDHQVSLSPMPYPGTKFPWHELHSLWCGHLPGVGVEFLLQGKTGFPISGLSVWLLVAGGTCQQEGCIYSFVHHNEARAWRLAAHTVPRSSHKLQGACRQVANRSYQDRSGKRLWKNRGSCVLVSFSTF